MLLGKCWSRQDMSHPLVTLIPRAPAARAPRDGSSLLTRRRGPRIVFGPGEQIPAKPRGCQHRQGVQALLWFQCPFQGSRGNFLMVWEFFCSF